MANISRNGVNFNVRIAENNTGTVIAEARAAIARALEIIGGKAESYTKALTPVKTGALKNSFEHSVAGGTVTVSSGISYAPYVELGTGKLYSPPPEWMEAQAQRGRGLDHWVYKGDDGQFHMGFPRAGAHMLQHGVGDHISEYESIIKRELSR